jgi:integrase
MSMAVQAASACNAASVQGGARRWVPWLCAYSGAPAGEICQLRASDVKCEDGIHFIELSPDAGSLTSGVFRRVPLHGPIIEQGFLDFVETRRGLRLFHMPDDRAKVDDPTNPRRPKSVKAREHLANGVRELGVKDPRISPNHARRRLWKPNS